MGDPQGSQRRPSLTRQVTAGTVGQTGPRSDIFPATPGLRRSQSGDPRISESHDDDVKPLFDSRRSKADPVDKFFKDHKATRFGWRQARAELCWWSVLPLYGFARGLFVLYQRRHDQAATRIAKAEADGGHDAEGEGAIDVVRCSCPRCKPNTGVLSHCIRLRPVVYVYFCAMWCIAVFLPVYAPQDQSAYREEHRYVRWNPLVAYIVIALLRTFATAGLEQMHRVEGYLYRKQEQVQAGVAAAARERAAQRAAEASEAHPHPRRPVLHKADSHFDEWSWSMERRNEERDPLGSTRLFDRRLRWILEIAAANSGNIRIRENTGWARGEQAGDGGSGNGLFAWMFRSHHPARISTVTSLRWRAAIVLVVLGFDTVVMNTYCSDRATDCYGGTYAC
jgi:hypothetical protein